MPRRCRYGTTAAAWSKVNPRCIWARYVATGTRTSVWSREWMQTWSMVSGDLGGTGRAIWVERSGVLFVDGFLLFYGGSLCWSQKRHAAVTIEAGYSEGSRAVRVARGERLLSALCRRCDFTNPTPARENVWSD